MLKLNLKLAFAATALVVVTSPLAAQGQGHGRRGHSSDRVPPGQLPPAGMCRVWIDDVPPGHQPAPTDCSTAERYRPDNARVIYGDDQAFPGQGKGRRANRDSDDGVYDRTSGRIGTQQPRVGRDGSRVGTQDPRVGTQQGRVDRRPAPPRTRAPGQQPDSTTTQPPVSTRPRTRLPL